MYSQWREDPYEIKSNEGISNLCFFWRWKKSAYIFWLTFSFLFLFFMLFNPIFSTLSMGGKVDSLRVTEPLSSFDPDVWFFRVRSLKFVRMYCQMEITIKDHHIFQCLYIYIFLVVIYLLILNALIITIVQWKFHDLYCD